MDTAFYDRIHAYLPGWELGKTRDEMYTNHFRVRLGLPRRGLPQTSGRQAIWTCPSATSSSGIRSEGGMRRRSGRSSAGSSSSSIRMARSARRDGRVHRVRDGSSAGASRNSSRRWVGSSTGMWPSRTPTARPASSGLLGCPESGGSMIITGDPLPVGSAYTLGTDRSDPSARKSRSSSSRPR